MSWWIKETTVCFWSNRWSVTSAIRKEEDASVGTRRQQQKAQHCLREKVIDLLDRQSAGAATDAPGIPGSLDACVKYIVVKKNIYKNLRNIFCLRLISVRLQRNRSYRPEGSSSSLRHEKKVKIQQKATSDSTSVKETKKKRNFFLAEKVPLGTFLDNRANEECKLNNGVGKSPCASFTFSTSFSTAGGCPEARRRDGTIAANSFFTTYAAKLK